MKMIVKAITIFVLDLIERRIRKEIAGGVDPQDREIELDAVENLKIWVEDRRYS